MSQRQVIHTDPEVASPRREDRHREIEDWNRDVGSQLAEAEGIEMTPDHWEVVVFLRRRYLDKGLPESARDVAAELAKAFSERGGTRFLHKLFPAGAVTQGSRIAGLPVPPHNEDASFGTAF
jgi:tRNA 2-thiouridine synthesizing protein E